MVNHPTRSKKAASESHFAGRHTHARETGYCEVPIDMFDKSLQDSALMNKNKDHNCTSVSKQHDLSTAH